MLTIDSEAKTNVRLPINLDNMARRYKTNNGLFTFPSPSLETINKNLFYLLGNSKTLKFNSKYKYRPSYLSYDEYGTILLDKLLMYVNGVFLIEDFILDTVVIPSFQSIIDILEDKITKIEDATQLPTINW